jgi:hypothetical protein
VVFGIWRILKVRRRSIFVLTDENDVVPVSARVPITVSEVTFDNVDGVLDFRGEGYARIFRRYLNEGQYGAYAWLGSRVVGHAWAKVCHEPSCRVNGYMDLSQGEALIHFCNVREDHRGKNIYPATLGSLCKRLFSEANVSRVLIDTEVTNKASLRGITKVGFRPLGTGLYAQFRGRLVFKHFTRWQDVSRAREQRRYKPYRTHDQNE